MLTLISVTFFFFFWRNYHFGYKFWDLNDFHFSDSGCAISYGVISHSHDSSISVAKFNASRKLNLHFKATFVEDRYFVNE